MIIIQHTSYAALHLYCIKANKWTLVSSSEVPRPPLAGHSATIHGDFMVVFGGLEHQIWQVRIYTKLLYFRKYVK